jgi:hypothetical protein
VSFAPVPLETLELLRKATLRLLLTSWAEAREYTYASVFLVYGPETVGINGDAWCAGVAVMSPSFARWRSIFDVRCWMSVRGLTLAHGSTSSGRSSAATVDISRRIPSYARTGYTLVVRSAGVVR